MRGHLVAGCASLLALSAGCIGATSTTTNEGNEKLGITEFQIVNDSAELTTIVGLDAEQKEVGRLELVHGRFTWSTDDEGTANGTPVDGRRMTIAALGRSTVWETVGYEPLMDMPAMPSFNQPLTDFVEDPHVKPILAKWKIGFTPTEQAPSVAGEIAYFAEGWTAMASGTSDVGMCGRGLNTTCPLHTGQQTTPAICPNGSVTGHVITDTAEQADIVGFCCNNSPGADAGGYVALKKCPYTVGGSTYCGSSTASQKCQACPGYGAGKGGDIPGDTCELHVSNNSTSMYAWVGT